MRTLNSYLSYEYTKADRIGYVMRASYAYYNI